MWMHLFMQAMFQQAHTPPIFQMPGPAYQHNTLASSVAHALPTLQTNMFTQAHMIPQATIVPSATLTVPSTMPGVSLGTLPLSQATSRESLSPGRTSRRFSRPSKSQQWSRSRFPIRRSEHYHLDSSEVSIAESLDNPSKCNTHLGLAQIPDLMADRLSVVAPSPGSDVDMRIHLVTPNVHPT